MEQAQNGAYDVVDEIKQERAIQDTQWGGNSHDDEHGPHDWLDYIQHQVNKGREAFPRELRGPDGQLAGSRQEWRSRMVKIAALAVAAIESHDRLLAEDEAVEAGG